MIDKSQFWDSCGDNSSMRHMEESDVQGGETDMPKSLTCKGCGGVTIFQAYVYAHWDTWLVFNCDCGRRTTLLRGLDVDDIDDDND